VSVLLDTHVWVWWLTRSPRLKARERNALNELAARRELSVAAISLWEVQMLNQKGRLELPIAFSELTRDPASLPDGNDR
jgi:PIN domain nuclease of toxin-antitoxin system